MGQTKHIFIVRFKKNIEKTFFADRRGIEQRFCRRSQQGAESRTHDRDQVLGGQVHEPGVALRADEGADHQEHGLHPREHGQRLLPGVPIHVQASLKFNLH